MAKILQIETATSVCSVAVSIDGKTVAKREEAGQNLHASNLTLFIEAAVAAAGLTFPDLDAVAVSKGPGSYTGLRIGVSTAKGLCYALSIPLIAIETLEMMSAGFLETTHAYTGLVCPMIDARRMEVYTALYDVNLNIIEPTLAKIIDENSFSERLGVQPITFIGDGAAKCEESLRSANAQFTDINYNSASFMSALAYKSFLQAKFEDVAYFEPFYLKDFVVTQPKKKV
ncbi:tRNA (adenosine(37)-N6)-threonylcarbamoyltransferase complex dimerization subunit type 1 TsaB [Pedobacter sp. MW01-1-1]|uniref:tRNA (adenosine(37)-N6)-threonylcarbamoyltransferase complex dimerization subunit type 1 TsaB n=1 Tax=Pedobacter sp. MW01-1-1 TaxID=3383027 RepID=UPI003FEF43FF